MLHVSSYGGRGFIWLWCELLPCRSVLHSNLFCHRQTDMFVCLHFWNVLLCVAVGRRGGVLSAGCLRSCILLCSALGKGIFFTFYSPNIRNCVELFPGPLPGMSVIHSIWGLIDLRECLISTPGWLDRAELLLWNMWGLCLLCSGTSSVWNPITYELLQVQWSSCISMMHWIWMSEF